jgi:co-chaperonin GroES (HSP10)
MATIGTYNIKGLKPLHSNVIVKNMNFHERFTEGGILIPGDDKKSEGIRPRWAEVMAVGPEQNDVSVGQYILVKHGRWTRGQNVDIDGEDMVIRRIDEDDILLVSDDPQSDDTFSNAITSSSDRTLIDGSLHNV